MVGDRYAVDAVELAGRRVRPREKEQRPETGTSVVEDASD